MRELAAVRRTQPSTIGLNFVQQPMFTVQLLQWLHGKLKQQQQGRVLIIPL